jgi:hypothetical protein
VLEVVNGLVTVIVPEEPVLPAVRSVSVLMAVLLLGSVSSGAVSGSPDWNTGVSPQPARPYQR